MGGLVGSVARQASEWPSNWYAFRLANEVMLGRVRSKSGLMIFQMPDYATHLPVLWKQR